jgi:hypothetical protein
VNVVNTTIGSSGLTFRSVAANGAASGIVLNNTGASGSLAVTGAGSTDQGGDNSGGTIQSTTGHGISLVSTTGPSFNNVRLLNTGDSGVNGTQVSGFSFTNGTITGAGDASDENSITFDDNLGAPANLTGAVAITNNVISQTEAEGVDIETYAGTISSANISNNAISDTGDVATPGSAVVLVVNSTTTTAGGLTSASLSNNTITDFRAGAGFVVQANQDPTANGPGVTLGVSGDATKLVSVTGNLMNGGNAGVGNQPDRFITSALNGNGTMNLDVSNNGTAANPISHIDGLGIELSNFGPGTATITANNNRLALGNAVGSAGLNVGCDADSNAATADNGTTSATVSGNNISLTDGPGIFNIARGSNCTLINRIVNNTVAAPNTTNAARAGIRVDSGSAVGDNTLCLEISGNTTAGSTNTATSTTSPGINLRKQGTDPAVNDFGIEGLSPSPTGTPTVENHVNSLNTSTSGTFGVGGTALLSAASGFTSCNAP